MDADLNKANWKRGYWSLIATQFQGAFNDTALKNLVIFLILAAGHQQSDREDFELAVGALFSLPFILFSLTGGFIADRFSKRTVTIGTRIFGVAIMGLGVIGLAQQSLPLELTAVFLLSTQSALFSPSKYGLLPELLPQRLLSWGNGVLELGTFVAIIAGSVAAGIFSDVFKGHHGRSGLILLSLSLIGLLFSLGITRVPAADPSRKFNFNMPGELWSEIVSIRRDRALWLAVVGNTYFWFLAALLQFNIFIYGKDVLKTSDTNSSLLQVGVAIGIGLGSLAAGYLSANQIEYGLIPLGSIGLTLFGAALALPGLKFTGVLTLLSILGFFAGFFAVPVAALIQHRPDDTRKGKVLGVANLLSFVGVLGASVVYFLMQRKLHWQPPTVFLASAIASALTTAYVVWLLPDSFLRLVLWLLTHTLYRVRVEGREHFPTKGPALLVPNHVSMVDAVLIIAATDRPIRFLMFQGSYEHPLVKPFAKMMRVIPVASNLGPRDLIHSLREATNALKEGELVCIFPEGQMTRIGQMLPFRRGLERIMKGVEAPIVPVHLDGVWGSIFSFEKGRFLWKIPKKIPYPVTVSFGAPMPPTSTAVEIRRVVQDLGAEAYRNRKRRLRTLHRSFIHMARRHPFRFAMADGMTPRLNFGAALARVVVLARRLRTIWKDQPMVGILLPPSVPGALVNFAALLQGRVPVNLNYTASTEVLASCAKQCDLKTVITSRAFLEKVKLDVPGESIFLEDLVPTISGFQKLIGLLFSRFLPVSWLEKAAGSTNKISLDDTATIIFSSGSTGDPKGVMLSHYNIASNVDQIEQIFMLTAKDRILGILPFFHSFGFTGTLCLPAAVGMGVAYHPNPLDSRAIGALVNKYEVTFLLATPTFLQMYTRRCSPEEFGSLQYVVAGAEKLPERISQAFEDQFGLRPLEGYGCTECSPVVSVNRRDFRAASFRQVGAKRGSIGHPLPGITVKVVDPETLQPLSFGQPGLLLVRGPNVMQGYLGRPEKTADVLKDGWYNTGDVAVVDEDGFIRITDRLSRFSKIGGEMVPHIRVEDKLHEIAESTEQAFAVTGIPDENKGERLFVLHTIPEDKLKDTLEKFAQSDLPALWKPRADQFAKVEALPYLGTGKLDLRKIKEVAQSLASEAKS